MAEPVSGRELDARIAHPLATLDGLALVVGILFAQGAMCHKCGYGTRCTSKRWAQCKRCGERVARKSLAEVEAALRAVGGEAGSR